MPNTIQQAPLERWQALKTMIGELRDLGYLIINGELLGAQAEPPVRFEPAGVQFAPLTGPAVRAYYGQAMIAEVQFGPLTYVLAVEQVVHACLRYQAALQRRQGSAHAPLGASDKKAA